MFRMVAEVTGGPPAYAPAGGRTTDGRTTGGTDLLQVDGEDGVEVLVPLAEGIVTGIDEPSGTVTVSLPEGLRELNTAADREPA